MTKRNILIAAVAIVGLVVAGTIVTGTGAGDENSPQVQQVQTPSQQPGTTPTKPATKPDAANQAEAPQVDPSQITTDAGPLVLLNPASGTRGSTVGISGSGFDAGVIVDIYVRTSEGTLQELGFAQTDGGGSFGGISYSIPESIAGGNFTVVVQQHNGDNKAEATGHVTTSAPSVKLGTQVGKAGDSLTVSGKGFIPGETVNIYFNSLATEPIASLKADSGGGLGRETLVVPYGAVGDNSIIFVGEKSQSPVTLPFLLLSFYPSASVSEYAAKADTILTFSGTAFGPGERVFVYLNSLSGSPVAIVQADEEGAFTGAGSFMIPFVLKGKNTFIFVGEQTQSAVTTGFDVLPYTPYAEASTYGGQPGTALTFYGQGFAKNEIVRVYTGRGEGAQGRQVACFMTNDQGSIIGGGATYTIPSNAQAGKMTFTLVGDKSEAEAGAVVQVMQATGPTQPGLGEQIEQQYVCPFDQAQEGQ